MLVLQLLGIRGIYVTTLLERFREVTDYMQEKYIYFCDEAHYGKL